MLLGLNGSLRGVDPVDTLGAPFGSFNLELRPITAEITFSLIVRILGAFGKQKPTLGCYSEIKLYIYWKRFTYKMINYR